MHCNGPLPQVIKLEVIKLIHLKVYKRTWPVNKGLFGLLHCKIPGAGNHPPSSFIYVSIVLVEY